MDFDPAALVAAGPDRRRPALEPAAHPGHRQFERRDRPGRRRGRPADAGRYGVPPGPPPPPRRRPPAFATAPPPPPSSPPAAFFFPGPLRPRSSCRRPSVGRALDFVLESGAAFVRQGRGEFVGPRRARLEPSGGLRRHRGERPGVDERRGPRFGHVRDRQPQPRRAGRRPARACRRARPRRTSVTGDVAAVGDLDRPPGRVAGTDPGGAEDRQPVLGVRDLEVAAGRDRRRPRPGSPPTPASAAAVASVANPS